MIRVCLDTNAIIDICYRYYPIEIFKTIWDSLLNSISAGLITFVVSEDIRQEIYGRVALFDGYSPIVLDDFFKSFSIEVIRKTTYQTQLLSLQNQMIEELPFFQNMKVERRLKKVNGISNDLSNIAVAISKNACVLTSEQGFNKDISKELVGDIKIPDTCKYKSIICYTWLDLFNHLGINKI